MCKLRYVRSDHPEIKDSLSLEQFTSLRHVVVEWPERQGLLIDQKFRALGISRNEYLRVPNALNMPWVIAATDMIGSIPSAIAKRCAEVYNVKIFPTPIPDLELPGYLMWHSSMDEDPGRKWLRNFLIDLCRRF